MNNVLVVEDLVKLYSNGRGVSKVNLSLEKGDVMGLLGPNGSGKTTTMKVITGLLRQYTGSVRIFGYDISTNFENAMAKVGSLIEAPALYEYLTATGNLKLMSRYYSDVTDSRIAEILEIVRLDRYKKDKVGRYSLGMKQRLGLAMALLSDPELVILDEPANGLDIEGIIQVREIILHLSKERGVTFLISSHIASEIEKTCNKVAVLHESEMLSCETTESALKLSPTLEDYFLDKVRSKRGPFVM